MGDNVRNPDERNLYSKGYPTMWNRELFKRRKINITCPVPFVLDDKNAEQIERKYYEKELSRKVLHIKSNQNVLEFMNIFHQFE